MLDVPFGGQTAQDPGHRHDWLESIYPVRLGDEIIAVADVVEAMSSHRPYRPSRGLDVALNMIASDRGRQYDPDVVRVCLQPFRDGGFTFT